MYSLRTHLSTGSNDGKSISTIDFYFLKKHEDYHFDSEKVDFAALKNAKKVQHPINYLPFIILDNLELILTEFYNSYASLTNEIYVCPVDFKKISSQIVTHMELSKTHHEFYRLFSSMIKLLNQKKSVNSQKFGKMAKIFLTEKDPEKLNLLYRSFRDKFDRLQTFCSNKKIVINTSERVYEELKYELETKTEEAFSLAFLGGEEISNEQKEKILRTIFDDAEIVLEVNDDLKEDEPNSVLDLNQTDFKLPVASFNEEFDRFMDSLAQELEVKEKTEKLKKIQESLLIKAKEKLINSQNDACLNNKNVLLYDIHTDASLNENKAGFGAVVCSVDVNNHKSQKLVVKMAGMKHMGCEGKLSTQIAELIAIQSIVKHMEDIKTQTGKDILFRVFSDNMDCVNALQGKSLWNDNGLIRKLLNDIKSSPVRLMYAFEKGHVGNKWNEEAHKLSRYGRRFNEEKFVRV